MLCLFDFHFANIIADGNVKLLLKKSGKIAGRKICVQGKFVYRDAVGDVAVNIVHAKDDWLGQNIVLLYQTHFSRIIESHLHMKFGDGVNGGAAVHLQNIEITEAECLL